MQIAVPIGRWIVKEGITCRCLPYPDQPPTLPNILRILHPNVLLLRSVGTGAVFY